MFARSSNVHLQKVEDRRLSYSCINVSTASLVNGEYVLTANYETLTLIPGSNSNI